jgi:hypothetical protein
LAGMEGEQLLWFAVAFAAGLIVAGGVVLILV